MNQYSWIDDTTPLNNDERLNVLQTLNHAEQIILGNYLDISDSMSTDISPIPINPNGENVVVQDVPIAATDWISERDAILEVLQPLINQWGDENSPEDHEENLSFLRHFSIPSSSKRQRLNFPTKMEGGYHQNESSHSSMHIPASCTGTSSSRNELRSSGSAFQSDQWNERFQDLVEFKEAHGHCLVPHDFPPNQKLAQWVKRQRYQYKLKQMKRHCTLSDDRELQLSALGFVWDSHKAAWNERFESLKRFRAVHGHCNVPSNFEDKSLAIWVKCQRRQYKLYKKGQRSTMTERRFLSLHNLGFDWDPRNLESS